MLKELLNNRYRIDFPVRWGKGNNTITVVSYNTDTSYDFVIDEKSIDKITLKNFCDLIKQSDIKAEKGYYEEV